MNRNVWTAASDGDVESVRAFLADGGDANAKDEYGYTPLYAYDAAIEDEHTDLIAMYESLGAEKSDSIAEGDENEDEEFPNGVEMEG
ncbi:hypothetical protein BBJ28_00015431 [Nothophytophthora sp. Chile5]|nr:hypothetical protein BBJ28_00015431 [Nothophytophthora sp. Chile5]